MLYSSVPSVWNLTSNLYKYTISSQRLVSTLRAWSLKRDRLCWRRTRLPVVRDRNCAPATLWLVDDHGFALRSISARRNSSSIRHTIAVIQACKIDSISYRGGKKKYVKLFIVHKNQNIKKKSFLPKHAFDLCLKSMHYSAQPLRFTIKCITSRRRYTVCTLVNKCL